MVFFFPKYSAGRRPASRFHGIERRGRIMTRLETPPSESAQGSCCGGSACGTAGAAAKGRATQLNTEKINRYKRHLLLPEVGVEGQLKLLNAKVLCIGAGGLGCPISLYLAAAGVGTIGLADIDVVSPSNLQRQVLFGVSTVGEHKNHAAAKRLKDVNPDCNVREHKTVVNSG